jgi:hypothetical protein
MGSLRLLAVLINVLNAANGANTAEEARPAVAEALAQAMILYGHPTRLAQEVGFDATEEVVEEEASVSQDNYEREAPSGGRADDAVSLVLALAGWAVKSQKILQNKTLAPKALLAIWKRFNFAQGRLFQDPVYAGQNRRYLGFMMHRSVVMFLHAAGVEALRSENLPLPEAPKQPDAFDKSSMNFWMICRIDPTSMKRLGAAIPDPVHLSDLGLSEGDAKNAGRRQRPGQYSCALFGKTC